MKSLVETSYEEYSTGFYEKTQSASDLKSYWENERVKWKKGMLNLNNSCLDVASITNGETLNLRSTNGLDNCCRNLHEERLKFYNKHSSAGVLIWNTIRFTHVVGLKNVVCKVNGEYYKKNLRIVCCILQLVFRWHLFTTAEKVLVYSAKLIKSWLIADDTIPKFFHELHCTVLCVVQWNCMPFTLIH